MCWRLPALLSVWNFCWLSWSRTRHHAGRETHPWPCKTPNGKSQREYYLNEQVKAIQKELGEEDERGELDALEAKIKEAGMSKEAEEKCLSELKN